MNMLFISYFTSTGNFSEAGLLLLLLLLDTNATISLAIINIVCFFINKLVTYNLRRIIKRAFSLYLISSFFILILISLVFIWIWENGFDFI